MTSRLFLLIGLAFFATLFFVWSRRFHVRLGFDEQSVIGITVTFATVIFSLLLAFTISNFNQRYYDIRDVIADEVGKLQLVFQLLQGQEESRSVLSELRTYVRSVVQEEWPALIQGKPWLLTMDKHQRFNQALIAWARQHPQQPLSQNLSDYLTSSLRTKRIQSAMGNRFLLAVVSISALLTLLGFWYLHIDRRTIQFLVDFGVIAIIFVSLYLLWVMSNPFALHEVALKPTVFEELLAELDRYLTTN